MNRFDEMEFVRKQVEKEFTCSNILSLIQDDECIKKFFLSRINTPGLRSYIGFKIYDLIDKKKDSSSIFPLLAAFEASIISTYAFNQIIDMKAFGNQRAEINRMVIAGNQANELMYRLIFNNYSDNLSQYFIKKLNNVHVKFYRGQYLHNIKWVFDDKRDDSEDVGDFKINEIAVLILDEIKKKIGVDLNKARVNQQVLRLFLINGHFFGEIAEIIGKVWGNHDTDQLEALRKWGYNVGIAEQIINDIMDFALPSFEVESTYKTVDDFFSDIKQGVSTMPIHIATDVLELERTSSIVSRVNKGCTSISLSEMEEVLEELCESRIIRTCLEISSAILNKSFTELNSQYYKDDNFNSIIDMPFKNKYYYVISKWWQEKKGERL